VGVARELRSALNLSSRPRPLAAGRPAPALPRTGPEHHLPVLLVHGYGGCATQWAPLRSALLAAGFTTVETFTYDSFCFDVATLARQLVQAVRGVLAEHEAEGGREVVLVGHSLGGVIVRHAVSLGGLDGVVRTAVTVAAPHGGCALARLGVAPAAVQLRPGSALLRRLEAVAAPGHARWITYGGGSDVVVPPSRARLRPDALAAVNVEVPDEGHLSILRSRRLARDLVGRLSSTCVSSADMLALAA
jgi:pimeloyl-ACP methyl ester carboxylesterase